MLNFFHPKAENGITGSFNLWWWGNFLAMCCIPLCFPVYLLISNLSVHIIITTKTT